MAWEKGNAQFDLAVKIAKRIGKDATWVTIRADKDWKGTFYAPGLAAVRKAAGLPELPPSAPRGNKRRKSNGPPMTVDELKATLALVHKHFGGDLTKARTQLEALREIGSLDNALKALDELEELRK